MAESTRSIDPTENVIALVEANKERGDDLRKETNLRVDAALCHLKEMAQLRADHAKEIRNLESDRLDKIRQVDVLAGNTAADRALIAIQTLASQTTTERETLRSLVTTTAATIAAQNSETVSGLTNRISQLEKSSYESGAGTAGEKSGRVSSQELIKYLIYLVLAAFAIMAYLRK